LSIYWTEINLIGNKIELLEKQKVEYSKELKSRITILGSEISSVLIFNLFMSKNILLFIAKIIIENERKCFNCRVTINKYWHRYLKEHYLCKPCHEYKIYNGKMRPQGRLIQTKMV